VIRLVGAVAVTHFETRLLMIRVGFWSRRQKARSGGRGQESNKQVSWLKIKDIFLATPLYPYTPIPFSLHLLFLLLINSNCHCLTLQDEFLFSTV